MNLVRKGYKMGFQKSPQLSKPLSKFETQLPPQQMELVRREVAGFLKKGLLELYLLRRQTQCWDIILKFSVFQNPAMIIGE